jgi:iron(III) transport system permease protein
VTVGFLVPAAYLVDQTVARVRFAGVPAVVAVEALNTVIVAAVATALAVLVTLPAVYAVRLGRGAWAPALLRTASLGYAVPGTVLAIGLLPIIGGAEAAIDAAARQLLGVSTGLLLLGSGAAIVYAYVARFFAVSAGTIEAGFGKVSPSLDAAARTLGATPGRALWRVHVPLLRPALATGALLVFVDCMKELPATLLLRPLGFETLATHLYGEAARGTYENAAIAALLIVSVGLVPVLLLMRAGGAGLPSAALRAGPAAELRPDQS